MTSPCLFSAFSSPGDVAPVPLASRAGDLSTNLTILEQVVAAEVAYSQQIDLHVVTSEDEAAWQRAQIMHHLLQPVTNELPRWCLSFARFVLERHGCSLHHHMARQLSPEAWACWFAHGGLLMPFR